MKEELKDFMVSLIIGVVTCVLCTGLVLSILWLASLRDGSLGHSCRPDGTCKGDLVCEKESSGFMCDLPKKEEKK